MIRRKTSLMVCTFMATAALILLFSGCVDKEAAPMQTPEVEKPTSAQPISTPANTPAQIITGEAKIAPWRIPPLEVEMGANLTRRVVSGTSSQGQKYERGSIESVERNESKKMWWYDEKGNWLLEENIKISYYPAKLNIYGIGMGELRNKTNTYSWKKKVIDRGILSGPNPIFSPSQVVFISGNNSYYSYVTIENKGEAGDVTLIVNANVVDTKENYIISKVFRMDKEEKVKAIVHFPENFPLDFIVYGSHEATPTKTLSTVSFEVRPSSWRDTSKGEIDIERV